MPGSRLRSVPRARTVRGRLAALALAAVLLPCASLFAQTNYTGNWDVFILLEDDTTWMGPAFVKEVIDTGSRLIIPGEFDVPRTASTAEGWAWGDSYDGDYFFWTLGAGQMDIVETRWWRGTPIPEKSFNIRCTRTLLDPNGNFSVPDGTYGGQSVSINKTEKVFASHDIYADGIMIEAVNDTDYVRFMLYPASWIVMGTSLNATQTPMMMDTDIGVMVDWEHDGQGLGEDLDPSTSSVTIDDYGAGRIKGSFSLFFTSGGNLAGSFNVPYQANGLVPDPDDYEPNNSETEPEDITVDAAPLSHTVTPGDVDWFYFDPIIDGGMHYVRISSSSKGGFGDSDGLYVNLYEESVPVANTDRGDPIAYNVSPTMNYYIEVFFTDQYGFYDIEVTTDPGVLADDYETPTSDNDYTTATELLIGAIAQTHTLYPDTDVDWYEVNIPAGTEGWTYVFETEAEFEPRVELFSASDLANEIAWSDWGELTFNFGGSYGPGTYYLRVLGTPTWYYIAARGVEPDTYDLAGDDDSTTDNNITVDDIGPQSHTIHADGNQDWMYFTAVRDQTYHIETSNHSGMELHLCVYEVAGLLLLREQDSRDEVTMLMKWTAPYPAIFYIMVESWHGLGNYDIEIRTTPAIVSVIADDPDNTDTVLSNGDTITITFDMDTNQVPYGSADGYWLNTNFDLGVPETFGDSADNYTLTWPDARTLVITVDAVGSSTLSLGDTITVLDAAGLMSASPVGSPFCTDTSPPIIGDWGIAFANTPPVAYDQSVTTQPGTPVQITLSASDPDGDTLTFEPVAGPTNGTIKLPLAETVTYTPAEDFTGTDSFTWKVRDDGDLYSSIATVTITVQSAQPTITITRPSGGEVWYVGMTQRIKWSATGVGYVSILYAPASEAPSTWTPIADAVGSQDATWGDYPWNVPDTPGTQYRIRIQDCADAAIPADSPQFEIRTMVDLDDDKMDDGWETDNFGDTSRDGAGDEDGDGLDNVGEFTNGTNPTKPDSDGDGFSDGDEVDAGTDPTDPQSTPVIEPGGSITVTYPNGGEVILSGDTVWISWDAPGVVSQVDIRYSTDSGATWAHIGTASPWQGSYEWQTPPVSSTQCRVMVSAAGGVSDESDDDFAIVSSAIVFEQESIEFRGMAGGGGGILVAEFDVRFMARSGSVTVMLDTTSLPDYVVLDATGFALAWGEKKRVTATIDAPTLPPETSIHKYVEKAIVATAEGAEASEAYLAVRFDVYPSRIVMGCVPPGPARGAGPGGAVAAACLFALGLALTGRARARWSGKAARRPRAY